ncbi:uncharacterized protein LOC130675163 [Microplitis mediator]|uniref:uncharacterized protein LOC130675163 n=1 Tax=Microplitis mediator TaxID=375433 RepID=UPI0025527184|nr:uncharacterized protein LOC130675163 [Microplitis mediator]
MAQSRIGDESALWVNCDNEIDEEEFENNTKFVEAQERLRDIIEAKNLMSDSDDHSLLAAAEQYERIDELSAIITKAEQTAQDVFDESTSTPDGLQFAEEFVEEILNKEKRVPLNEEKKKFFSQEEDMFAILQPYSEEENILKNLSHNIQDGDSWEIKFKNICANIVHTINNELGEHITMNMVSIIIEYDHDGQGSLTEFIEEKKIQVSSNF